MRSCGGNDDLRRGDGLRASGSMSTHPGASVPLPATKTLHARIARANAGPGSAGLLLVSKLPMTSAVPGLRARVQHPLRANRDGAAARRNCATARDRCSSAVTSSHGIAPPPGQRRGVSDRAPGPSRSKARAVAGIEAARSFLVDSPSLSEPFGRCWRSRRQVAVVRTRSGKDALSGWVPRRRGA
jgi:hypothetical protein